MHTQGHTYKIRYWWDNTLLLSTIPVWPKNKKKLGKLPGSTILVSRSRERCVSWSLKLYKVHHLAQCLVFLKSPKATVMVQASGNDCWITKGPFSPVLPNQHYYFCSTLYYYSLSSRHVWFAYSTIHWTWWLWPLCCIWLSTLSTGIAATKQADLHSTDWKYAGSATSAWCCGR